MQNLAFKHDADVIDTLRDEADENGQNFSEYLRGVIDERDAPARIRAKYERKLDEQRREHERAIDRLNAEHEYGVEALRAEFEDERGELRAEIDALESAVEEERQRAERAHREKQQLLAAREENKQMLEYVDTQQHVTNLQLTRRRHSVFRRAWWWLAGDPDELTAHEPR